MERLISIPASEIFHRRLIHQWRHVFVSFRLGPNRGCHRAWT